MNREKYEEFMELQPTIVLDTNVLLDLFRVTTETCKALILMLSKYIDSIWLPQQVIKEYSKHHFQSEGDMQKRYKDLIDDLRKSSKDFKKKCMKSIDERKKYDYCNVDVDRLRKLEHNIIELIINIEDTITTANSEFYNQFNQKHREMQKQLVEDFMNNIDKNTLDNSDISYSNKLEILNEGELRYKYKIPPGYMDDIQYNKPHGKNDITKFGDLFLWKEILNYSTANNKNVLLITQEKKEDWYDSQNYKYRNELFVEFEETCGKKLVIIDIANFYYLNMTEDDNKGYVELMIDNIIDDYYIINRKKLQDEFIDFFDEYELTDDDLKYTSSLKSDNLLNYERELDYGAGINFSYYDFEISKEKLVYNVEVEMFIYLKFIGSHNSDIYSIVGKLLNNLIITYDLTSGIIKDINNCTVEPNIEFFVEDIFEDEMDMEDYQREYGIDWDIDEYSWR